MFKKLPCPITRRTLTAGRAYGAASHSLLRLISFSASNREDQKGYADQDNHAFFHLFLIQGIGILEKGR